MMLSLTVHEYAHAWTALKLGDDTAYSQGRLTLNPLAHIDPIGTVMLPVISILFGGLGLFGWAKPVPVMPHRFRRGVTMRRGMIITSVAGPASNILFAFVVAGLMMILGKFGMLDRDNAGLVPLLLTKLFEINLVLAIFNMLPVYPLDGHRLLPERWKMAMARYGYVSMLALLFLIQLPPVQLLFGLTRYVLSFVILGFWGLFF